MKKIGKLQALKEKTIQEEISESCDFTCPSPGGSLGERRYVSFFDTNLQSANNYNTSALKKISTGIIQMF